MKIQFRMGIRAHANEARRRVINRSTSRSVRHVYRMLCRKKKRVYGRERVVPAHPSNSISLAFRFVPGCVLMRQPSFFLFLLRPFLSLVFLFYWTT